MNKTSTNSLIFYFDKAKQKNVCWGYMKKIAKYFVLLSRNNPLMLIGLKSVNLKIIQMYHFWLKWKRYTVCTNWWDSNFFWVGLPLFPVGLLLFARWESWTPVFKILVRALLECLIFWRHTASFRFWFSKIQDFGNLELSPMRKAWLGLNYALYLDYCTVCTGLKSTWIYGTVLKSPWKLNLP